MPRTISGPRQGRSVLTPSGDNPTAELDFQLAGQQGIRILSLEATVLVLGVTETTDTSQFVGNHSLHRATGTLEAVPDNAGEDAVNIDSEILLRQDVSVLIQEEAATRGGSHSSMLVLPTQVPSLVIPILVSSNLTHRAISDAGLSLVTSLGFLYEYVEFSLSELGVLFARRE